MFCNQLAVLCCRAGADGGAIAVEYYPSDDDASISKTVMVACNVTSNTAQSEGGGLRVSANGVTLLINNAFTHNQASMGGAISFAMDDAGKLS